MNVPQTMMCARLHEVGGPLILEEIATPRPGPRDVLVRVRACGIVPNLANVLAHWPTWFPEYPLPRLPAIFGLDPAGEVVALGEDVLGFAVGDRVYVNPGRGCETCRHCLSGDRISCKYYATNGYFGHSEEARVILDRYPYAGFGEYMTAPVSALVRLSDNTSFEEASRFGYIGTAYGGLRKTPLGPNSTLLINGTGGTLGLSAVVTALAMGVRKIFGTGRNKELLAAVKAISPGRIEVFSTLDGSLANWIDARTSGEGVDVVLDCLGPGSPEEVFLEGVQSLGRGGTLVNVGAVQGTVPIVMHHLSSANRTLIGSTWFRTAEAQDLAAMAESGILNLSVFEHRCYPLDQINEAIAGMTIGNGFVNYVINP